MKKKLIAFAVAASVIFGGCGRESSEEVISGDITSKDNKVTSAADNEGETEVETQTATATATETEKPDSKIDGEINLPAPVSKEFPLLPKTEETLLEFTGIPSAENPEESFGINRKYWGYNPICFDGDKTYFSNPKDNQNLYVYDGENAKCILEMPVNMLNFYEGKIYFISSGEPFNIIDYIPYYGFLFSFDPASGELKRLTDYYINDPMYVTSEGIFFASFDTKTVYKLDEGTGDLTPLYVSYDILNYNGYYYKPVEDYDEEKNENIYHFCLSNGEKTYSLFTAQGDKGWPKMECIVDGKMYFKKSEERGLKVIDLRDGTYVEYPDTTDFGIYDYIVYKGKVYILSGNDFFEVRDGELFEYTRLSTKTMIEDMYSGPNGMYAWVYGNEFAELIIHDENGESSFELKIIT